jgi:hypothetical protein
VVVLAGVFFATVFREGEVFVLEVLAAGPADPPSSSVTDRTADTGLFVAWVFLADLVLEAPF